MRDEGDQLLILQQIHADLRHPGNLGAGGDNVPQQQFRPLAVDGEVVVNEEDRDLALLSFLQTLEQQEFSDDAVVRPKADGISEKSGHRTKFASVRAATPRLNRNHVEAFPGHAKPAEAADSESRNAVEQVELAEVHLVPGDFRVIGKGRLDFFAVVIDRRINLPEGSVCRIGNDPGPDLVSLAQRHRVGVTRLAVAPERFAGNFSDVRTSHDDGHAGGAQRVRHAICLARHASHKSNARESDRVTASIFHQLGCAHPLCVAIHQQHLMAGRRQRFQ